jgi:hypothetical protein
MTNDHLNGQMTRSFPKSDNKINIKSESNLFKMTIKIYSEQFSGFKLICYIRSQRRSEFFYFIKIGYSDVWANICARFNINSYSRFNV